MLSKTRASSTDSLCFPPELAHKKNPTSSQILEALPGPHTAVHLRSIFLSPVLSRVASRISQIGVAKNWRRKLPWEVSRSAGRQDGILAGTGSQQRLSHLVREAGSSCMGLPARHPFPPLLEATHHCASPLHFQCGACDDLWLSALGLEVRPITQQRQPCRRVPTAWYCGPMSSRKT